ATRRARERILTERTYSWEAQPQTGKYVAADRISPSLQPTAYFRGLQDQRELFGRLLQFRTGHGYFGNFYYSHVTTENTCPRGEYLQTREHIIRACP
ncbi:hypothetical protein P691DRAFT_631726, partial [Macrolepiota fuliginosa MF-IS2]